MIKVKNILDEWRDFCDILRTLPCIKEITDED